MKRVLAVLAFATLLTGCSTTTNSANAANQSGQSPIANAIGNNNQTSDASNAVDVSQSEMKTIATGLLERYILSHNDKDLPTYKVDVDQFLIPGLAKVTGETASSGVDYNHPVKSYHITIGQLQANGAKQFAARATLVIQYAVGKETNQGYIVKFTKFDNNWLIQTII